MGEYIRTRNGETVKLGTCEDLFYCTYDELVELVKGASQVSGNLPPRDYLKEDYGFRFRFPFGDHDDKSAYEHAVIVPASPGYYDDKEHYKLCHSIKPRGEKYIYNVNCFTPCPLDSKADRSFFSTNGPANIIQIIQQKMVDGALWTVVQCPYCGARWRMPPEQGEELAAQITTSHPKLAEEVRKGYTRRVS